MKEQAFWKNYFYRVSQLRCKDEASGLPAFPAPPASVTRQARADSAGSNRSASSGLRTETTPSVAHTQPRSVTSTTANSTQVTTTSTSTNGPKTMTDAERKAAAARASNPVRPAVKQPRSFALEDDGTTLECFCV